MCKHVQCIVLTTVFRAGRLCPFSVVTEYSLLPNSNPHGSCFHHIITPYTATGINTHTRTYSPIDRPRPRAISSERKEYHKFTDSSKRVKINKSWHYVEHSVKLGGCGLVQPSYNLASVFISEVVKYTNM